ncbi:MAG: hypothetical protein LBH03_03855 [Holophagales bacterium]|jgi:hypothetical protein|nr:hypothetical protein [Holophagales bacterium]
MNKILQNLSCAVLLVSPMALMAQDEGEDFKMYVSFGQNVACNHALSLTGSPWGGPGAFHSELGIEFLHKQSTLLVRPNGGYTRMLSKKPEEGQGPLYDLLGVYIGFDLVYNISKRLPLTATMGPSFHSWSVERTNPPPGYGNPNQFERRMKVGWRMGLGYNIDDRFRVDFTYTMTEWRRTNSAFIEGLNPCLPSYFTLKGTYTF